MLAFTREPQRYDLTVMVRLQCNYINKGVNTVRVRVRVMVGSILGNFLWLIALFKLRIVIRGHLCIMWLSNCDPLLRLIS